VVQARGILVNPYMLEKTNNRTPETEPISIWGLEADMVAVSIDSGSSPE
jgi:hypothetical protein